MTNFLTITLKSMLKFIQLKLVKIRYKGDSIGDDIGVEIEALGKFLRVDKTIKIGATSEINREIGNFETEEKNFKINTKIIVIEKDLLFNDIGIANLKIEIDTTNEKPQNFSCEIEIKEARSILGIVWGKKTAIFEVTLEAKVSDAILCVPKTKDGWLKVVLKKDNSIVNLPTFLQVKTEGIVKKREHFIILEGFYRGESATVKLLPNNSSQFISIREYNSVALAKYSISKKVFIFENKEYKATDHPDTPWKKGVYDIEIPSAPKQLGTRYLDRAKFAKVWFLIGHSGERFLHPGKVSLGCMTITEIEKWDSLCEKLLKSRKGDFMSVGIVEVID